jgi:hypothetical protein
LGSTAENPGYAGLPPKAAITQAMTHTHRTWSAHCRMPLALSASPYQHVAIHHFLSLPLCRLARPASCDLDTRPKPSKRPPCRRQSNSLAPARRISGLSPGTTSARPALNQSTSRWTFSLVYRTDSVISFRTLSFFLFLLSVPTLQHHTTPAHLTPPFRYIYSAPAMADAPHPLSFQYFLFTQHTYPLTTLKPARYDHRYRTRNSDTSHVYKSRLVDSDWECSLGIPSYPLSLSFSCDFPIVLLSFIDSSSSRDRKAFTVLPCRLRSLSLFSFSRFLTSCLSTTAS